MATVNTPTTSKRRQVALRCRDLISLVVVGQICYMTYGLYLSMVPSDASTNNVVLIIVDDLRPQIGCYGWHAPPFTPSTPYLDQLAQTSVRFTHMYAQQSMCAPSRASFLTSRRPDTTRVYDQTTYWRTAGGNFTTIPQYFKHHGYETVGMGKVFHGSPASGGDDPLSWSAPFYHPPTLQYWGNASTSWQGVTSKQRQLVPLPDELLTTHAVMAIEHLRDQTYEKPLFLAVGFYKPHLPLVVPQEYLDMYPLEGIQLSANPYIPDGMPKAAWSNYSELRQFRDVHDLGVTGQVNTTLPEKEAKELMRAYYAAVSYIDDQIGSILSAIHRAGIKDNTIVALLSDNGYHLGEHAEWTKHTNFEQATRVPLFLRMPGLEHAGEVNEEPAELVDLFPTLAHLADLPVLRPCPSNSSQLLVCTEGSILKPFKEDSGVEDMPYAISQTPRVAVFEDGSRQPIMGYSMRNNHFRYTEWVALHPMDYTPDWGHSFGLELYDHRIDPDENVNRAGVPEYTQQLQILQSTLQQRIGTGQKR